MRRIVAVSLVVLFAAIASSSCDRLCGDDAPANVAGDWQLNGEAHCVDSEDKDTSVDLTGDMTLPIAQSEGALSLRSAVPLKSGSFTFSGNVHGSCADFTVMEVGDDYSLSYNFKGVVNGSTIEGDVSGSGQGVCPFEGSFTANVYGTMNLPRTDGGVPYYDGGIPDGSTSTTTPRAARCYRNDDCELGACIAGECAIICSVASDCNTGQKCVDGRCDTAEGCNCDTTDRSDNFSGALFSLALLWWASRVVVRSRRRRMRSSSSTSRIK